jgi:uncharacterized SAM-binding protein YcdF (DUF218 family)
MVAYLGITAAQVWSAARDDGARPADAIVVLGAAQYNGRPSPVLAARLDHAVELYEAGLAPVIVVTGGGREGDLVTEGLAGYRYLLARGIPESALLLENGGSNSWQSLAATARFLLDQDRREVLLVSSPYHALRTEHIAAEVGLVGHASPTRSSPEGAWSKLTHYGRETVAVSIGRVIGYGRLVRLDEGVGRARGQSGTG